MAAEVNHLHLIVELRDFMILITPLKLFPKIPMGTCEETSLKVDMLIQFFWQKTIVNDKIWLQKKIQNMELTYQYMDI